MMKKVLLFIAMLLLVLGASMAVFAASVSYGPYSVPLTNTDWTTSILLQQFDPSLGTLNSISFTLDGHAEGTAKFESEDLSPTTVTMDLSAILELQRPDLTNLVVTIPVVSTSDDVTAYDNVFDYGGTSGRTYTNLSANKSESATTSSASDKTLFTGTGFITLPVVGNGASTGSGGGNLTTQFTTQASASASVTYDYTAVPEPGSLLALASGLLPLGLLIRRKR